MLHNYFGYYVLCVLELGWERNQVCQVDDKVEYKQQMIEGKKLYFKIIKMKW